MNRITMVCGVLTALACAAAREASAQSLIEKIEWQAFSKTSLRAPGKYVAVEKLSRPPSAAAAGKVRAMLTIENPAKLRLEAINIEFAVSAKLRKIGSKDEAVWAVPFRVAGRSLPMLAAGQKKAVPIETLLVEPYLKQLFVAGYWPVSLKLVVQVRPRKDVPLESAAESELPVEWEVPNARP